MKLISITSDPTGAGSGQSLVILLQGLQDKGVNVLAIIPCKGVLSQQLDELGIPYEINKYIRLCIWPPKKSIEDKILFLPRLFVWRLYDICSYYTTLKIIKKNKPTIIHSNVSLIRVGYDVAKKLGIKHIWHIREYGDKDFGFKYFPKYKTLCKILKEGNSICITKQLKSTYKLDKNTEVIYDGIRPYENTHYQITKAPYFLYVGSISERKGVTDLITAYIKYREKGGSKSLKLLGPFDKRYKDELEEKCTKENIKEVEFLGFVNNVNDYMSEASALVVPSKYEALGRIVGEAMFNGCLVIGRDTAGIKEQLDNGLLYTGSEVALRFNNVEELTKILFEVDNISTEKRNEIIVNAQKYIKENLSSEYSTDKIYSYVLRILSN